MSDVVFGLAFFAVIAMFSIGALVVWIWALVDVLRTPDDRFQTANQLIWVLVVVFANVIGAIIYLVMGRPRGQNVPPTTPPTTQPGPPPGSG